MEDFQSKYSGEQVEEMLDQIANGEAGGGGIETETDPIFSASPAASITEEKKSEWDDKVDKDQLVWTQVDGEAGVRLKGTNGTATGNLAISAGDDKTASDGTAFASAASGDHAVAFGYGNTCAGRTTLAQGLYNIVNGKDSVAFGQRNLVNGDQAFAAGQQNEVTTRLGVAIGYKNKATNTDSVAIGYQNTSSGSASVAMGDTCEANGTSSTAMGYKTKATGAYSSTFGENTQATNEGEVAMGAYNKSTTSTDASEQTAFSFGIGTSDTDRTNALEIKKNGDVYIGDKMLSDFATTTELSGKVDKVSGKQLSTEDFTSVLKTKLEGLSNYDDTELSNALSSLQTQFNTLVSGNASDAINSFNEIIAFLDGVKDTEDLSSIIASIEQQIAAKQDKIEGLEDINEKLEQINNIVDEEGYLYSNGEKVDMRFTRSLLPVGTSIPAKANLNTIEYLKIGKYYCSLNVDAKTITNCPTAEAFSMEVFNPLGTNVDDETTKEYTYRVRVLTAYKTGMQYIQYCATSGTPGSWTYNSWKVVPQTAFTMNSSKNGGSAAKGANNRGVYIDSTGTFQQLNYTIATSVPSGAVFTDTKVTAVGNHYTPTENASSQIDAPDGEVVTGIKRDAAGHVVGVVTAAVEGGGVDLSNYATKDEVNAKYSKPSGGIPKSDLASAVQTSLGKADTALQSHQDISGKQDKLVSGTNIKTINGESILGEGDLTIEGGAKVYEWFYDGESESVTLSQEEYDNIVEADLVIVKLGGVASFTVSKTDKELSEAVGMYNLTGQFDLQGSKIYIQIVISIATKLATITIEEQNIPTQTSQLENDSNFITSDGLKTINGESILGSGNIMISGGSGGGGKEYVEAPISEEPIGTRIDFTQIGMLEPNKVYVATSNEVWMLNIEKNAVLTTSLCDEYTIMFKAWDGGAVLSLPTDWIIANELPELTGYVEVNIVRTAYQGNNVFKVVVCDFKPVE